MKAKNDNGDVLPAVYVDVRPDDSVERRLLRMQAEAGAFRAPEGLVSPAGRKAFGRVDTVALGHEVIAVQALPAVAVMAQYHAEVAATSMAAELARDEMRQWGQKETKDDLFAGIQLGQPVYLWFREAREGGQEEYVVRRVVGDSRGLWTEEAGHGVRVTPEMQARCCGRVWTPDEVRALRAPPPDEALRADARETACFAVYDALCVLVGEARLGLQVTPDKMQVWAQRVLESLLRADVGWAIATLADADAALRMRVREPSEALPVKGGPA
jgi:hypothetical protein